MTAATTQASSQAPPTPARRRRPPLALRSYFLLLLVLLYLPIAILFVFSFNDSAVVSFPLRGFTLEWYQKVVSSTPLLRSVWTSIEVAVGSSLVATVLGTMLAILLTRFEFRSKPLLAGLAALPLIVPYVVLGVALLILFRAVNVPLSVLTVGAAHAVVALPFTTLIILARLVGFGNTLEEAAMDLGASYPMTLRLVILPIIGPSIIAAWLVAFTISFDEFALALFLAGPQPTFPVYLFGQLRFASTLPVLIAAAVMLMLLTLGTVMVSEAIRRRA